MSDATSYLIRRVPVRPPLGEELKPRRTRLHALVMVFVEPTFKNQIEQRVHDLMDPYFEDLEVPPYMKKCDWCPPDPATCLNCNGTGSFKSTYNPRAKWCYFEYFKNHHDKDELLQMLGRSDGVTFAILIPGEGWFEQRDNPEPDAWHLIFKMIWERLIQTGHSPVILDYEIV